MSLVAYDGDITDSEEDEPVIAPKEPVKQNAGTANNSLPRNDTANAVDGLFGALPAPKQGSSKALVVEEADDEFLKKKPVPAQLLLGNSASTSGDRKPARIVLPSLSDFDDDDDKKATKFKKSVKGTGLLSVLPPPKSGQTLSIPKTMPNKSFIPHVLTQKPAPKPQTTSKPNLEIKKAAVINKKLITNYGSSDESDSEETAGSSDFFSLNDTPAPIEAYHIQAISEEVKSFSLPLSPQESHHPEVSYETYPAYEEQPVVQPTRPEVQFVQQDSGSVDIDNEVLRKLCGSRARHKGESVQIIDIDQKEILPDPREWLTKALTEDNSKRMSTSKRRGDEPTTQQRKKHQITYLAHQAKANEQELQNQWANNRLSKKQTQSKYGF